MNDTDWLIEPPPELKKTYRHEYWRKVCMAIIVLARTGISTAPEIALTLAQHFGVATRSYSLLRLIYKTLADDNIVNKRVVKLDIAVRITILQLTDYGKELARVLGVEPVESEYERILRLHDGENQPKHTAQVLFTAYQARLRGFDVKVMPFEIPDGKSGYQPDLTIAYRQEGLFYPVEVETHSRNKPEKWQGKWEANVVLPNPRVRQVVVQRLKNWGIHGKAADLQTLARQAKKGVLDYFWLELW